MNIRYADMSDLAAVTAVEAACFPPAEAATQQDFAQRLRYYSGHFWLMFDGGTLIAFVDGFVTDEPDLTDDMYENAALHNENGAWQMIFGVNTLPEYRQHGYAGELLRRAIDDARKQGRKGLVLTCKEPAHPLLRQVRLRGRGRVREVHPRERGVAPDAADVLTGRTDTNLRR